MTSSDRERILDIRNLLHSAVMEAGQIDDKRIAAELEVKLDNTLTWLRTLPKEDS